MESGARSAGPPSRSPAAARRGPRTPSGPLERQLSNDRAKVGFPIPETLRNGRYALGALLGQGGMAVVCVAHDTALRVDRAVKLLLPHGGARSTLRRRLKAEARAMARLQHPNILSVHDVGVEGEFDYVVMDLAAGGSLQDLVERGTLNPSAAIQYMVQVLSALAAAHAAGVVHRDVKPHNILLDQDGRALLADFGIALLANDDRRTKSGVAMGSLAFMPPEQRLDAAGVGPSADIYAAGSTLFSLLTGTNPVDLFLASEDSPRWGPVPPSVRRVIRKACEMSPKKRWETAGDMARALMQVLDVHAEDFAAGPEPLAPAFPSPSHAFTNDPPHGPTLATLDAVSFMRERLTESPGGPLLIDVGPSHHGTVTSDDSAPQVRLDLESPDHATLPIGPAPVDGLWRFAPAALVATMLVMMAMLVMWAVPTAYDDTLETTRSTDAVEIPPPIQPRPKSALALPPLAEPAPPPEPAPAPPSPSPIVHVPPPTPSAAPVPTIPAGSSPVTGSWTGSAGGIIVTLTLRGPPEAIHGRIGSLFKKNEHVVDIVGTFSSQTQTLSVADVDTMQSDSAHYELTLTEAGTRLVGNLYRNVGGQKRLELKKTP